MHIINESHTLSFLSLLSLSSLESKTAVSRFRLQNVSFLRSELSVEFTVSGITILIEVENQVMKSSSNKPSLSVTFGFLYLFTGLSAF